MDNETRILMILGFAVIVGIFKFIGAVIGSPAERAARELEQEQGARDAVRRREEAWAKCEQRAAALWAEFPTLADGEIATLMRDELINMRSPHREYYDWITPENIARVRRTVQLQHIRAQRNSTLGN